MGKEKKRISVKNVNQIQSIMMIFLNNFFTYTPPAGVSKMQVENALTSGVAALYKCCDEGSVNFGKWCVTPAHMADVVDNNGLSKKITTGGSDYSVTLKVGVDCVLLFNNSLLTGLDISEKYSILLEEIDKTILSVVKWAKVVPIPKVFCDGDIAKYTTVMKNILDGELINVVSDNSRMLMTDSAVKDDFLSLTDPQSAEKLHFLSEFREEVLKRISTLFGVPFNTTAKSAQALNSELHGMDIFSLFVITDMYNARKESFERAKKFMGHEWNFGWSEIMKHQINDVYNHGVEKNDSSENI